MDRLIYIAMTGAKHALEQQAATAHNLANATTAGFRAQLNQFRAVEVHGEGVPTRAFVVDSTIGSDFRPGAIQQTGRDLDVAVEGAGWIAVQAVDGGEAYTRSGSLQISENGLLQTRGGLNVVGDGGTITIPPGSTIAIARDGTISLVPQGAKPAEVTMVGRIKLVNPPESNLVRGADGLFRMKDGGVAEMDPKVNLVAGAIESSNVNVVNEMVDMITQARQFDLHMKLLQHAENNDSKASQLLSLN